MSPRFPHGMRSATTIYSSSVSSDLTAYEDLPGHHPISIQNLIATSPDELYPDSDSEEYVCSHRDQGWNYSGFRAPEAFRRFQVAADYCLTCSDDSITGDYDPSRECFVIALDEQEDGGTGANDAAGRGDPGASRPVGMPPDNAALAAQLVQARELETKLTE